MGGGRVGGEGGCGPTSQASTRTTYELISRRRPPTRFSRIFRVSLTTAIDSVRLLRCPLLLYPLFFTFDNKVQFFCKLLFCISFCKLSRTGEREGIKFVILQWTIIARTSWREWERKARTAADRFRTNGLQERERETWSTDRNGLVVDLIPLIDQFLYDSNP